MAGSKRNEIREAMQRRVKRFSPFDLLGISNDESSTTPAAELEQSISAPTSLLEESQSVPELRPSDVSEGVMSDVSEGVTLHQTVPSDARSDLHIADSLILPPADTTSDQFEVLKNTDTTPLPARTLTESIPLAPLQWRIWQVLLTAENKVLSYQGIASQVKGSIPGIRQAIRVIEKEGGILSRMTVREKNAEGAILQGFRVVVNKAMMFHSISAQEARKLQPRRISAYVTSDSLIPRLSDTSDSLRMYVGSKIHTYMPEMLRLCPPDWQIREQTLVKIAETFPSMSAIELRRSIRYLVEQAKTAKQSIQNPNAWLKAAFERNSGPLVTERMIEAQIDQRGIAPTRERVSHAIETEEAANDLAILRSYIAATSEEKAIIDHMAEERLERILDTVSADKHEGIRAQARMECARDYFKKSGELH